MALSPEEKAQRKRDRMIEKIREKRQSPVQYARNVVATVFQEMIRAEAAVEPAGMGLAVVDGRVVEVFREVGQCVCVTCGKVRPWKSHGRSAGSMDAGHYLAGRYASILLKDSDGKESNCHPQCSYCNDQLSGNQGNYTLWMQHVYGQEEIDRLQRLRAGVRQFTVEEVVDMRLEFGARLKAAEERMKNDE